MKLFSKTLLSNYFFIFFLSFSIIMGSSYNTYLSYERFYNADSETYMNIAKFDFKEQSLIRRYRVIIPALAYFVSQPISKVYYNVFKDKRDKYDWPLLTGFFLINSLLLSLATVLIYRIMKFKEIGELGCIVGLCIFLTGGRWASFIAGHPTTDSLTIVCIAAIVYGLIASQKILLAAGIILGLLSKESVGFFFPMILLFANKKIRLTAFISIPIALLFYFFLKYFIDRSAGSSAGESVNNAIETVNSISISAIKLTSFKGLGDLFSVYGFFNLVFFSGLFYRSFRKKIAPWFNKLFIVFLLTIILHMLLSTELARMFYLGSALFVPLLARSFEINPLFKKFQYKQVNNLPPGE